MGLGLAYVIHWRQMQNPACEKEEILERMHAGAEQLGSTL